MRGQERVKESVSPEEMRGQEAVKKLSSDRREGEQQLLKVARPFGIARVPRLFFFAVEPSYAGISCSVRFRPNHLVRL